MQRGVGLGMFDSLDNKHIVGKTILLFKKVYSQMKMGTSQIYMTCVFWIARTKQ